MDSDPDDGVGGLLEGVESPLEGRRAANELVLTAQSEVNRYKGMRSSDIIASMVGNITVVRGAQDTGARRAQLRATAPTTPFLGGGGWGTSLMFEPIGQTRLRAWPIIVRTIDDGNGKRHYDDPALHGALRGAADICSVPIPDGGFREMAAALISWGRRRYGLLKENGVIDLMSLVTSLASTLPRDDEAWGIMTTITLKGWFPDFGSAARRGQGTRIDAVFVPYHPLGLSVQAWTRGSLTVAAKPGMGNGILSGRSITHDVFGLCTEVNGVPYAVAIVTADWSTRGLDLMAALRDVSGEMGMGVPGAGGVPYTIRASFDGVMRDYEEIFVEGDSISATAFEQDDGQGPPQMWRALHLIGACHGADVSHLPITLSYWAMARACLRSMLRGAGRGGDQRQLMAEPYGRDVMLPVGRSLGWLWEHGQRPLVVLVLHFYEHGQPPFSFEDFSGRELDPQQVLELVPTNLSGITFESLVTREPYLRLGISANAGNAGGATPE